MTRYVDGDSAGEGGRVHGMVESKATLGLPSALASPDLRKDGVYSTARTGVRCLNPSTKHSARASSDAGVGKRKPALVLALEPPQ